MVIWLVPILAMIIAAAGECLHVMRVRKLGRLAFGPTGFPRLWVLIVPPVRILSVGALVFSLLILMDISGKPPKQVSDKTRKMQIKHLMIALDVSPSMEIKDAGPSGGTSRAKQARTLLKSIMERLDMTDVRVSIIPFYTSAKPLIIDTFDPEVVNNVLQGLPLDYAFEHGKTDMYSAVNAASEIAKSWPIGSAMLVVVSDGDTLTSTGMQNIAPAIADVIVVGVGNTHRGTFIDGHASRQDSHSLKRLALQLQGLYHDGTSRHVPTDELVEFASAMPVKDSSWKDLRFLALLAAGISSFVLVLISPALALLGTSWRAPAYHINKIQAYSSQGAAL